MSHYDHGIYDESVGWVVVDGLTNPETSDEEFRKLGAMATPAEIAEATRRLDEELGGKYRKLAEVQRLSDELVNQYPALKLIGNRGPCAAYLGRSMAGAQACEISYSSSIRVRTTSTSAE